MGCKKLPPDGLSPCTQVCKLRVGYCIGCKRTMEEIGSWSKMSEAQKKEVLEKLKTR